MLLSARFHISETVTGLIGAMLIGVSLWWSVRFRDRNPDATNEAAVRGD